MSFLIYCLLSTVVFGLQCLPLSWVARLGRGCGALAYLVDRRHRRQAITNLEKVFGESWGPEKVLATAREHFRRLGENYCCAVKAAAMSDEALDAHVELKGLENLEPQAAGSKKNRIVAIGDFGNTELYTRIGTKFGVKDSGTTYRRLKNAGANRVMEKIRANAGIHFFERKRDVKALRERLKAGGFLLGLLADHRAGGSGERTTFLGHPCSSTAAPVLLSARYDAELYTAICYRVGLAQWTIEIGPSIPWRTDEGVRPKGEVVQEIQDIYSKAVRRDPANWFWVHNRWRLGRRAARGTAAGKPTETEQDEEIEATL